MDLIRERQITEDTIEKKKQKKKQNKTKAHQVRPAM